MRGTLAICAGAACAIAQTLTLYPQNPHYFFYDGKPAVLITSGEHYGSVLNLKFDFARYLAELQRNGFNLTRTFTGSYREEGTSGHGASPLSPGRGPEHFIAPWAWSDATGGFEGRKFDLDRWNPAYFARLRRFCREAERRGVIVELVVFSRMYSDERWRSSALHPDNNLQGEAWRGAQFTSFIRGDSKALLDRQKAMVRKIVTELRDTPNVYFEIANEPAARLIDSEDGRAIHAWHDAIAEEIASAEAGLPSHKRHLIAWNSDYGQGIGPTPRNVSVINFHYLPRLAAALDEYGRNKLLGYDETRWVAHDRFPQYRNTMTAEAGRIEAWEFLLGGGAVYSNLNHAYQVEDPEGRRPESERFKRYLTILKRFVEQNGFERMRQDRGVVTAGVPAESFWRAISEPGKQYAIYVHHSSYAEGRRSYVPSERTSAFELTLNLPRGSYNIDWIAPASGGVLRTDSVDNPAGAPVKLRSSPQHTADIALRIGNKR